MKNWVHFSKLGTLFVLLLLAASSCVKDSNGGDTTVTLNGDPTKYKSDIAREYNEVFLELERFTAGYRPPIAGRTTAYLGLIGYEALIPGMEDKYTSFDGYFQGLDVPEIVNGESYHWPTVYNAATAKGFSLFFPTAPAAQLFQLFALEQKWNDQFRKEIPNDVYVRSVEYGRQVANTIHAWGKTDALGHESWLRTTDPNYVPPTGEGKWQPTFPDYSKALLPYWGKVRTFAADETDIIPAPLPYSKDPSSEIYKQALETFRSVNQVRASNLQSEDKWIADFWSDDCPALTFTPAGRWVAVANQVVEKEQPSLAVAAETYARMGFALNDAGVRSWHEKYRFNYQRPVDYIRQVIPGGESWNSIMCPDGSGRYFTPPFPAYPSGHATFGGAAAGVLEAIYGTSYAMTDRCHEGRTEFVGKPRTFKNFREMAEENGYSRIPIGVHFRMDYTSGVNLGYGIAAKINKFSWRK
jgi:PAP2 superfamily